jgi:hypothetical protein
MHAPTTALPVRRLHEGRECQVTMQVVGGHRESVSRSVRTDRIWLLSRDFDQLDDPFRAINRF